VQSRNYFVQLIDRRLHFDLGELSGINGQQSAEADR
jgi:hypothetical protein